MALAEFIVTFREFFEISLVIGIMLVYLRKTGARQFEKHVYLGALAAALASILVAFAFESFIAGGFEAHEALFEGLMLVVSSGLVTWLILWMMAQKDVAEDLRHGLRTEITEGRSAGVVLFSFIAVFREGVEIVLFLAGINITTGTINLTGALIGVAAALLLAYAVFRSIVRLDFKTFFTATSVILILLAAGLLSQGVHELQEASVLPTYIEHVYDINPPLNEDGTYPLLHEKGAVGSIAKGLVGYDGAPSLLQSLSYFAYLLLAYLAYSKHALRARR